MSAFEELTQDSSIVSLIKTSEYAKNLMPSEEKTVYKNGVYLESEINFENYTSSPPSGGSITLTKNAESFSIVSGHPSGVISTNGALSIPCNFKISPFAKKVLLKGNWSTTPIYAGGGGSITLVNRNGVSVGIGSLSGGQGSMSGTWDNEIDISASELANSEIVSLNYSYTGTSFSRNSFSATAIITELSFK